MIGRAVWGPVQLARAGSVLLPGPRNVHPDDWVGLSARRDDVAERLCASFVYGSGETFEYCRSFAEANSDSFGSAIPTSGKGRPGERAMLALVGRTDEEVRDVDFLHDVARLARVTLGPNAVIVTVVDSVEISAVAMVVGPGGTRYCLLTPERQPGPVACEHRSLITQPSFGPSCYARVPTSSPRRWDLVFNASLATPSIMAGVAAVSSAPRIPGTSSTTATTTPPSAHSSASTR